jgi:ketosteroid isomerase-like protein
MEQNVQKIKKVAMELDNALEKKNFNEIKSLFSDDCEIEFLGIKLNGRDGVEKWLKFIFEYVESFKLEPIVIIVEGSIFVEEFYVDINFRDGSNYHTKWSEVLIYENYKVKSLRLYFDRLEIIQHAPIGYFNKKILGFIDKKTLKGLK